MGVLAAAQFGVDAIFETGDAKLLEPTDLSGERVVESEVAQRLSPP